jgi:hypothetical protein
VSEDPDMQRETGVRGSIYLDEARTRDPLLRLISELRDQVDRLIDEQKGMIAALAVSLEDERERGVPELAAEPVVAPPLTVTATATVPEPAPRSRRPAPPAAFERLDEASPTPPRPVSTSPAEPAPAAVRSDDPRERLDALARHLDRKLKQPGGSAPAADALVRHQD